MNRLTCLRFSNLLFSWVRKIICHATLCLVVNFFIMMANMLGMAVSFCGLVHFSHAERFRHFPPVVVRAFELVED